MQYDDLIFFVCFSLIFFIPGFLIIGFKCRRQKRYSQVTEGKIIEFQQIHSSSGRNPHPIYEYFVDGKRYSKRGGYSSFSHLQVGMPVSIMYDPDCPSQAWIKGHDSKIYTILGIIPITLGTVFLLVFTLAFFLTSLL